jgi:tRNA-modifying protein YgfZ
MLSDDVHDALGVRWDAADAARLPRNYGDPAAEYEAARHGCAIVERRDRRFLRAHGRDPVRMVQGLISNDIAGMTADRAVYATVLTPKGKMVADVRVLRRGADLLLETAARASEPLSAHLKKFVPPLFARFDDAQAQWTVLTLLGPDASRRIHEVLGVTPSDDIDAACDAIIDEQPVIVVTTSHVDVPGFDIIAAAPVGEALWTRFTAAGCTPAGQATLDVLRIEAGTPVWGAELTENTIPLEAGLRERAISETKGCYTGQEVIIRILHRGHVNWHLRGVLLGDASAPARETPLVKADGKPVGRITSSAWSPTHGQTIALAYVRREVEPGTSLFLGEPAGRAAMIVALPFTAAT